MFERYLGFLSAAFWFINGILRAMEPDDIDPVLWTVEAFLLAAFSLVNTLKEE